MKVLLIEDDSHVAAFIVKGLEEHGHNVQHCLDGKDGLFFATSEVYDVMVIDRMLPSMDGLSIIQAIRGSGNSTPILILSALDQVADRVKGLKSGSDDYLVKPFSFSELLARLEILSKRGKQVNQVQTEYKSKDLVLKSLNRSVSRAGNKIELQAREFNLLEYLLQNKGQVVTRTMLLEHLWNYSFDPQTNVIDVHVSRLRNKIDKDYDEKIISTIRGSGYIIYDEEPDSAESANS